MSTHLRVEVVRGELSDEEHASRVAELKRRILAFGPPGISVEIVNELPAPPPGPSAGEVYASRAIGEAWEIDEIAHVVTLYRYGHRQLVSLDELAQDWNRIE